MLKSFGNFRSLAVLVACQALAMTCSAMVLTTTAIVGRMLAPEPAWATVPLAIQFLGLMMTSRAAAHLMQRFGRRAGFTGGALAGLLGSALATRAIIIQSFAGFCLGAVLIGVFLAHAMHYRFAAAESATKTNQSQAISWVMAGGILAAVLGPQLANWSKDLFAPITFAGAYAVIAGLCLVQGVLIQFARFPAMTGVIPQDEPDSTRRNARPPGFVPAVICGMVGYGTMNLIMGVTPPAMADCGLAFGAAAFVIQWHVFAMYAPSFGTGHLIARFGLRRVLLAGTAFMTTAVAVNLSGESLANFSVGLVCLGVGWNFLFVGATTWLTRIQSAKTMARLQGTNDTFVFGTVAATSLGSGWVLETFGWTMVNLAALPALGLVLMVILTADTRQGDLV